MWLPVAYTAESWGLVGKVLVQVRDSLDQCSAYQDTGLLTAFAAGCYLNGAAVGALDGVTVEKHESCSPSIHAVVMVVAVVGATSDFVGRNHKDWRSVYPESYHRLN